MELSLRGSIHMSSPNHYGDTHCPHCNRHILSIHQIVKAGQIHKFDPFWEHDDDETVGFLLAPCLHTVEGMIVYPDRIEWKDDREVVPISSPEEQP